MSSTPSGKQNGFHDPSRRLRFDDFGIEPPNRLSGSSWKAMAGWGHSGRKFIVVAAVTLLLIWGGLYIAFQRWRASYRERAAWGASHVVSAIEPLQNVVPPGVDATAWHKAVDETREMLRTIVASNLLNRRDMNELRLELDGFVSRAHANPETAQAELAAIWNEMADRAEFLFQDSKDPTRDRHVRPKILPPRPTAIAKARHTTRPK